MRVQENYGEEKGRPQLLLYSETVSLSKSSPDRGSTRDRSREAVCVQSSPVQSLEVYPAAMALECTASHW
ncbi:hypothetical protein J4Q44_G00205080 [Coregonus suidteri]|uniref:Uncharacterized protein n=1 Tax=Coregonus suidteri TaxID=861788 RepID=A0AAN8LE97_9TELE